MHYSRPIKEVKTAVFVIAVVLLLAAGLMSIFAGVPRYAANMPKAYVEQVIANGYSDVGIVELSGNNDGKRIDTYARTVKMPLRSAYCYAAIYTWCQQASSISGYVNPLPRTGSTQTAYNVFIAKHKQSKHTSPHRGDILIWRIPRKWLGHAALITKVNDNGRIKTIEANTSRSGTGNQRDGSGVWVKQRFINRSLGRLVVRGLIAIGS